ncbi:MAG: hypothetical protein CMJ82_14815 [Planctomycetaceae bacterium]|nr:hypothetical protein [Planctomycetaceae bacterium]|tara:strand:- start:179 stop:688 length:510 start_codon:yes stop_codon:yes gene_type:complete
MELQITLLIASSMLLGYMVKSRWGLNNKPLWVDQITGLPNRADFERSVEIGLRSSRNIGLIIIDLDDFKSVNDHQGHLAGDRLLRQAAEILLNATCDTGTLFRWGGDEFVLLIPAASDTLDATCISIEQQFQSANLGLSCSTGSTWQQANDTAITLFERADQNLYSNKS